MIDSDIFNQLMREATLGTPQVLSDYLLEVGVHDRYAKLLCAVLEHEPSRKCYFSTRDKRLAITDKALFESPYHSAEMRSPCMRKIAWKWSSDQFQPGGPWNRPHMVTANPDRVTCGQCVTWLIENGTRQNPVRKGE